MDFSTFVLKISSIQNILWKAKDVSGLLLPLVYKLHFANPKLLYSANLSICSDISTFLNHGCQYCQKSWNGWNYPETVVLPILWNRTISAKFSEIRTFPEHWYLCSIFVIHRCLSSSDKSVSAGIQAIDPMHLCIISMISGNIVWRQFT